MHKYYTEPAVAGLLLQRALVRYAWTRSFLQVFSMPRSLIQSLGIVGVSLTHLSSEQVQLYVMRVWQIERFS